MGDINEGWCWVILMKGGVGKVGVDDVNEE